MDEQAIRSINWNNLTAQKLREEASDPKSRLPSLFERQWVVTMGTPVPCFNCKGLEKSLVLFKKKLKIMADNKCNYVLKGLYNGVYGYTNAELTDKKAEKLAKAHARGYDLFSVLPAEIQKKIDDRLSIEQKEANEILLKAKKKIEADKEIQIKASKELIESRERDTMVDKQLKAEAVIKEATENAGVEASKKKEARLNQLLSWDRSRLVKKAKSIKIKSIGSTEELAKRIHKNE